MSTVEGQTESAIGLQFCPLGKCLGNQLVFVEFHRSVPLLEQMFDSYGPAGHCVLSPDPAGAEDTSCKHADQLQLEHGQTGLTLHATAVIVMQLLADMTLDQLLQ